ncbi:MAG: hypothetical protein LBI28_05245 [Treponema sp.]|jgi:hypothetical protein|nr:hypothetical protein [Treponema sp.]
MLYKIIFISINFVISGVLALFPVTLINKLEFTTQVYILEEILKGDPVIYGTEVMSLYILAFFMSFFIFSIIVYIIINKIEKIKYSKVKLLLTILALLFVIVIVSVLSKDMTIILAVLLLPTILVLAVNNRSNANIVQPRGDMQ